MERSETSICLLENFLLLFSSVLFSVYCVQGIIVLTAGEMLSCVLRSLQPGVDNSRVKNNSDSSIIK